MRTVLTAALLLSTIVGAWGAQTPAFIALPTTDSLTVRLMPEAGYRSGTGLSYEIGHWPDGAVLSSGRIEASRIRVDESGLHSFVIDGLRPRLWTLSDPQLYTITLKDDSGNALGKVRIGFRRFEIRDRRFYLNGVPVFLRGLPINPPRRDLPEETGRDPEFVNGYLSLVKQSNANLIRTETPLWLDACDELGILVFQGNYGPAPGGKGTDPPTYEQAKPGYREIVANLANHPSVVIYVLTNEVDYKKTAYKDFLTEIREEVRMLDPTRPVIGNAGFGLGEPGELFDVHPYSGWYSGNISDWYGVYSRYLTQADKAGKPLTLSECVGAYTSDAGLFLTMSKQLVTMMRWNGPVEDQKSASLDYQAELVKHVVEIGRRARTKNTGVASIMPFTYFLGWANAKKPEDLIPKPALSAFREAFAPTLISTDLWRTSIFAGDTLRMRLCVVNDDDQARELPACTMNVCVLSPGDHSTSSAKVTIPIVPYYSNAWAEVSIPIPSETTYGRYLVRCDFPPGYDRMQPKCLGGLVVAPRDWVRIRKVKVTVYDPKGRTATVLKAQGADVTMLDSLAKLPENGILVIGEEALGADHVPAREQVKAFLGRGGRILCLRQSREAWDEQWLPAQFAPTSTKVDRSMSYIHPIAGSERICEGIEDFDLWFFNEIGRSPEGVPDVCPVINPLRPASHTALKNTRIWAVCDQALGSAALLEVFEGGGSVVVSQFKCVDRANDDPIAARLLANLVHYCALTDRPEPIDLSRPIKWGWEAIRSGVFSSPKQGFLLHSEVYRHEGGSKGMLGADHAIDGVTLAGAYTHNSRGWIDPVPDPKASGWGIVYGSITTPTRRLVVTVRNPAAEPAQMRISTNGVQMGEPVTIPPGEKLDAEFKFEIAPGPIDIEFRGDQRLVISESRCL